MRLHLPQDAVALAFALLLSNAVASPGLAAVPAKTAPPVGAFIDPQRLPRAALLEAKLLAEPGATWVERTTIDRVLKEQVLQAAFGPQGGTERVQLGKLLKADLLVLVRSVPKAAKPALEVVVSDTARGLRLMVRAVPVTKDADADVAALRQVVQGGVKTFQEDVRAVVAVPPFASTNLSYDYEYLKGAYARLVEQAALAYPGVVVVELQEAEAIAREIKIADPGARVSRLPALYLLSEFRHQGRGAALQVVLKLRATRDGKPVGAPVTQTVAPADAPVTLHRWVSDQLAKDKAVPTVALDREAEAQQLAELSRSRQRVGDWDDAYALLEASLLLEPNQPELNADAMAVLRIRMQQMLQGRQRDIDLLRRVAQLHRRGYEHMEALITSRARLTRWIGSTEYDRGGRLFMSYYPFPPRLPRNSPIKLPPLPPAVQELARELEQERRDVCLRLLPLIAKDGNNAEFNFALALITWRLPVAERWEEFGRLLLLYQDSPLALANVAQKGQVSPGVNAPDEMPIYRKMFERLKKEGNAEMQAAAERSLKRLAQTEKEMVRMAAWAAEQKRRAELAKKQPRPVDPASLTPAQRAAQLDQRLASGPLRVIRLTGASPADAKLLPLLNQIGVIAAGPGIDVFWGSTHFLPTKANEGRYVGPSPVLLVMRQKGRLRRVWARPGAPDRFSAVCFDGRYVWAATEGRTKAPALFLLDPVAEKVVEVTSADGLPQPPEDLVKNPPLGQSLSLRLCPLDRGRVCVAGGFGRAWVGVATFDPGKGKAMLKVIHEAREASNQVDREAWLNPHLAFTPVYLHTLRGPAAANGKASLRVLLGRATHFGTGTGDTVELVAHPLVIDPDQPAVTVMKEAHYVRNLGTATDGSVRVVEWIAGQQKVKLLRIDYPGKIRDLGFLAMPPVGVHVVTQIVAGRLHIAGERIGVVQPGARRGPSMSWWTADLDGTNLRKEADDLPEVRALARSAHYGFVAVLDMAYGPTICEVHVKDAGNTSAAQ